MLTEIDPQYVARLRKHLDRLFPKYFTVLDDGVVVWNHTYLDSETKERNSYYIDGYIARLQEEDQGIV